MNATATKIRYDELEGNAGPDDLNPNDSLVYFSSYRDYDHESDLSYGDLHPCDNPSLHSRDTLFVLPAYLSGSDYSGGSVTVSNHRLFIEEFGELEGVHNVYGGYSSYGVAIRADVWNGGSDQSDCTWYGADEDVASCNVEDGPCPHQIREWLKSIEDYPVADEDDLGQVEMEAQDEGWESWAESDFVREIEKLFPEDIDDIDVTESGKFRCWFEDLREAANVYWENETGNNAHVDVERVAAELEDIGALIKAVEENGDGAAHGFKLELLRRVSYLPYCQTCGLLISEQESDTGSDALQLEAPSHLKHERIAVEKVVYADSESE